ncbi:MAG: glycerol-3-phosphate 1-O-acyltransferase PlsY [Candidatus Eiseniibacteriota bacterium]
MSLLLASVLIAFALGSIPSGLLIGRARGVDLTAAGSKNIGATNAFRVLGPRWGGLVFAMDVLKGLVATFLPAWLAGFLPNGSGLDPRMLSLVAGVAAILGHVFTPWLGFRGGRGVATSLGVFLGIMPVPSLLALALWVVLLLISRRVSVGSVGAALAYPFLVAIFTRGDPQRAATLVVASLVSLLILVRHLPNIRRLLNGTEPPILGVPKEGRP